MSMSLLKDGELGRGSNVGSAGDIQIVNEKVSQKQSSDSVIADSGSQKQSSDSVIADSGSRKRQRADTVHCSDHGTRMNAIRAAFNLVRSPQWKLYLQSGAASDSNGKNDGHDSRQTASQSVPSVIGNFGDRTIADFEILRQIGLGAYGEVYKARDKKTLELVALKKLIVHEKECGYSVAALREIKFMKTFRHPNILSLKEVVASSKKWDPSDPGPVYIVLPYFDNDLVGIICNRKLSLSIEYVKCYMKQLLQAIYYLHLKKYMHRDLKTANILVNNHSELVLADWGFARTWKPNKLYTTKVVTLWYRAPELLLGVRPYTQKIDMWAIGCIFFEMLHPQGEALFPGSNEIDQLQRIFKLCGTPSEKVWPGVTQTPNFSADFEMHENSMDSRFSCIKNPEAVDLLKKMLTLDPRERIGGDQALDHDFFWKDGAAKIPKDLPMLSGDGLHEYEVRKKREHERAEKLASRKNQGRYGGYHNRRKGNMDGQYHHRSY